MVKSISAFMVLALVLSGCASLNEPTEPDRKAQAAALKLATNYATVRYFSNDWQDKKENALKLRNELKSYVYDENYVPQPNTTPPALNGENVRPTKLVIIAAKEAIERSTLKYADKAFVSGLLDILAPYFEEVVGGPEVEVPVYYLDFARAAVSGITSGVDYLEKHPPTN